MQSWKVRFLLVLVCGLILVLGYVIYSNLSQKIFFKKLILGKPTRVTVGKPYEVKVGDKVKVKYSEDYTVVFLGDSMTEMLGNFDELRSYLGKYYPDKSFALLNYGFGSTNILSALERLEKETYYGRVFRPILDIDFDLILIESFGHNPLSEYPLTEGLAKQTDVLNKIVNLIQTGNPRAKIVFMTTIAPNNNRYAEGVVNLTLEQRQQWVAERVAYIENHIQYAWDHKISLINTYEKSLGLGGGNLDYISTSDFIHPSPSGIYLISEEIAKGIYYQKLLP